MARLSRYLLDRGVQTSDDTTFTLLLPKTALLSALDIRLECTNGTTAGQEILADAIDSIQIADGSKILYSAVGRSAYAYDTLLKRRRPAQVRTEAASAVQELFLRLSFGYHLWDNRHYLPLSMFANPELRLQYSPTIAVTGFLTGTFTISVIAHYWEEAPPGGVTEGWFRFNEVRNFTSVASGDEPTLLPVGHPLLGLLVFIREAGIALETDVTRLIVESDRGGQEVINARVEDLAAQNHDDLELEAIERGIALRADAATLDVDVNFLQAISIIEDFALTATSLWPKAFTNGIVGDRVTLAVNELADATTETHATLSTTRRPLRWMASGRGLPHALWVPLHEWGRPETAYRSPASAQPRLLVRQGGAGATVRVHTLELVTGALGG